MKKSILIIFFLVSQFCMGQYKELDSLSVVYPNCIIMSVNHGTTLESTKFRFPDLYSDYLNKKKKRKK